MEINVIASGSTGNCYKISDGANSLLLDAGIPYKKIQHGCGYDTSSIAACLITHRHGDHSKAVPEMIRRGIPVYSNADVCSRFCGTKKLEPFEKITYYSYDIIPFPVEHDVECYAYLIYSSMLDETLLYVTDTAFLRYKFSQPVHYIMAEANYDYDIMRDNSRNGNVLWQVAERILNTHMSIDTLIDALKVSNMSHLKEIYLLHLSSANSDSEAFKQRVQKATGAAVYVC